MHRKKGRAGTVGGQTEHSIGFCEGTNFTTKLPIYYFLKLFEALYFLLTHLNDAPCVSLSHVGYAHVVPASGGTAQTRAERVGRAVRIHITPENIIINLQWVR